MKTSTILSEVRSRLSFIESEIIQLDEEVIQRTLDESEENKIM